MTEYLSCAETAKLVRGQLKAKFPGVKFSVKSSVYSGGASIRVGWMDGPTIAMVDKVAKPFAGGGFDGMIDMKFSVEAFLMPDGSASFAQTSGTAGSGGVFEAGKAFKPAPEAKRVRFGADYLFTDRDYSRGFLERALVSFQQRYGAEATSQFAVKESGGRSYMDVGRAPFDMVTFWYQAIGKRAGIEAVKAAA